VHSIGVFAACWGKTDRLANSQRQNGKTDLRLRPPLAGLQLIRGGLRELEVTEEVLPNDVASFRNKTKQNKKSYYFLCIQIPELNHPKLWFGRKKIAL
jgi:hypothetical protein